MTLSPKTYVPVLLTVAAGLILWAVTGDKSSLIVSLTGIAGGGFSSLSPVLPGVHTEQVKRAHQYNQLPPKRTKKRR
jgi:hypothetical protein